MNQSEKDARAADVQIAQRREKSAVGAWHDGHVKIVDAARDALWAATIGERLAVWVRPSRRRLPSGMDDCKLGFCDGCEFATLLWEERMIALPIIWRRHLAQAT
jgi:hypothetical protein